MKLLFDKKEIEFQTKIIAKKITDDHRGDKTPIVMVGLLNGAFMFYSDLVRNLDVDVECDFMRVKSYVGKKKQGDIQIIKDLETSIKGKHVYLIDDILDSGNTMRAMVEYLEVKHPASISSVTLLTRKDSPIITPKSYEAFTIGEEWVVGYGMDNEKGYARNYDGVFAL
jgi:hypoxanthine phosphoribosyltransferase